VRGKRQAANQGVAKNHSRENFAHDFGLPHFHEQPAQKLRKTHQEQQEKENLGQL